MRSDLAPSTPRRRLGLALCAIGAALVLGAAGCSSDDESPAPGAEGGVTSFVPAGSPAYADISTDFEGEQWTQLDDLARLFPGYPDLRAQLDEEVNEGPVTFEEIRPVLGERAGVALLRLPPLTDELQQDPAGAATATEAAALAVVELAEGQEEAVRGLLEQDGYTPMGECEGSPLLGDDEDTIAAIADGAMLFSDAQENVCAGLAAHAAGGAATLAGEARYTDALNQLPEETFAEGYFDIGRVVQEVASTSPELEQLGLTGDLNEAVIAASMAAEDEGIRVQGLIANAPASAQGQSFDPTLLARAPADSFAYIGFANLAGTVGTTLGGLEGEAAEQLQQQLEFFSAQLEGQLGVTVDDLRALTSGEHAVVVAPGVGDIPGVALALTQEDGARAQATLDRLRTALPMLIQMMDPTAAIPDFTQVELENGVQGWQLPLAPEFGVVYGVDGDLAIIGSTDDVVRSVQAPGDALADAPAFQAGTEGLPDSPTGVLWINIEQTLAALEQAGALDDADAEVLPNLRPLKSLAAWSEGGETPTFTTFLRITE